MRASIFSCYLALSNALILDSGNSSSNSRSNSSGSDKQCSIIELLIDSGWHRIHFARRHSPQFRVGSPDCSQISITGAFCPDESWGILHSFNYILTIPRVFRDDRTNRAGSSNVTLPNDKYSTTFSMIGKFEAQLRALKRRYKMGFALIRADSRVEACGKATTLFKLITNQRGERDRIRPYCERLHSKPSVITNYNIRPAAESLLKGKVELAWIGGTTLKEVTEKCAALNVDNPERPKIVKYNCKRKLPFLCTS